MKLDKNKPFHLAFIMLCIFVVLIVLGFGIALISDLTQQYNTEVEALAKTKANAFYKRAQTVVECRFNDYRNIANEVAGLPQEQLKQYFNDTVNSHKLTGMEMINGSSCLQHYGPGFVLTDSESASYTKVMALLETKEEGHTGVYIDEMESVGNRCIAVYYPIQRQDELFNGVLFSLRLSDLLSGCYNKDVDAFSYYITEKDGNLLDDCATYDISHTRKNIYDVLAGQTENDADITAIKTGYKAENNIIKQIDINNENTIYVAFPAEFIESDNIFIQTYSVSMLVGETGTLSGNYMIAMLILCVLILAIIVCFLLNRHYAAKQSKILEDYDPQLGCSSYNKFIFDTQEYMLKYKRSSYAIIYLSIQKFNYIVETFGRDTANNVLKYTSLLINKSLGEMETYGRVINESFGVLLRYTTQDALAERLKTLNSIICSYKVADGARRLHLSVGVYLMEFDSTISVADSLERARIASKVNEQITNKPFIIYDNSINSRYVREAEIESKMESALANGEFRLFFQPKLNVAQNRLDSAEVLVRWYSPVTKQYSPPDEYIGLFESNGFIVKLDHYVFEQSCRFISEMARSKEPIVPLSVNVSRVTAMDPGFADYYIRIKNKYALPNGFLTLEFTESFANESYEILKATVSLLKKNGFCCSVDDFGVGYSAMNILKELDVDELKIDKALLKVSDNPEKDDVVLGGITKIAHSLGIKTVQEGVETQVDLDRVKTYGCDIVQGYFYSRPLHLTDFVAFIKDKRRI